MIYLYLFFLVTTITLIFCFKNYKKETFLHLSSKEAPLKILYGFSMIFAGKNPSMDKSFYDRLKAISLGICAFIIIISFGLIYSIIYDNDSASTKVPSSKETSTLSIAEDDGLNESIKKSTEDVSIEGINNEDYLKLKETIATFEKYRKDIEKEFLAENESYLSINKPLNLITEYGEEKIGISWSFETPDVIDKDGNIIYENIDSKGCSTLAYATLSLNDTTATLTIPICISPP